jgi:hypothetical protein
MSTRHEMGGDFHGPDPPGLGLEDLPRCENRNRRAVVSSRNVC